MKRDQSRGGAVGGMTGGRVACSSDALFLDGPAGYCHLKQNDKIYSI